MSVLNPQKSVCPGRICCGGTALVTLCFDAAAELKDHPADIVLATDRSCSMDSGKMLMAKQAAMALIHTIASATARPGSLFLGCGTRMGLVSYSCQATEDVRLTREISALEAGISRLSGSGKANHRAGLEAAEAVLGPGGKNRQILILFTAEKPTDCGAAAAAERMKKAGVEIYCIGLTEEPGILPEFASIPLSSHTVFCSDPQELPELFQKVAGEIVIPGAKNILIQEEVAQDFLISAVRSVSHGHAQITGSRTLVWAIDHAGLTVEPQSLSLTFEIRHTGTTQGARAFNHALTYQDSCCRQLLFPCPTIEVSCEQEPVCPEGCPEPTVFTICGCEDAMRARLNSTCLSAQGRILQLDLTLKAVCPGKRVAVSVILSEIGKCGEILPRGVRHILVPAQKGEGCRDVELRCIPFSMPESLKNGCCHASICSPRTFQAQVIANYVDTDFSCCEDPDPVPVD